MTKREENQNLVFEKKVLRTICGPKLENGLYKRRYNYKLEKTNILRYAGHMIRRPEDLPQKVIFTARPQGTRWQGRPKIIWADCYPKVAGFDSRNFFLT
jgi:hypothetical protein